MSSDLELLLSRQCEMEKAALVATYPEIDAFPVAFWTSERLPYWTNRIVHVGVEWEGQEEITYRYTLAGLLVLAHFTEGVQLEAEGKIAVVLPLVLDYFANRRQWKRTQADSELVDLDALGGEITGADTLYSENSGIGVNQFGIVFTFEIGFTYQVNQIVS